MWSIFITVYLCEFGVRISPSPQEKADSSDYQPFSIICDCLYPGSVLLLFCYQERSFRK